MCVLHIAFIFAGQSQDLKMWIPVCGTGLFRLLQSNGPLEGKLYFFYVHLNLIGTFL